MSAVVEMRYGEANPAGSAEPVVVVGTGPVGIRVAQEILRCQPQRSLMLFGDEPWLPYNRVQLSSLLAGEVSWSELQNPLLTNVSNRVFQHHNCAIVSIDRENRTLLDREGRTHHYGTLVLAVGSRAHVPSIPGISQGGVFHFRDMSDMQLLAARNARSRRIVVLGGGLLGLEAARGLCRAGTDVTVIEHASRLMPNQLDQAASELLQQHISALGIRVILGDAVQKVLGDGAVTGVRLRESGVLNCDTLVLATGIRPNIDLARNCGLHVGRGVVIDDQCLTSDPHIYAVGECAEHRGQVYGLVAPGFEQAAVAAHGIAGNTVQYAGSLAAARLKVIKLSVFSLGCVADDVNPLLQRSWVFRDDSGGYRKLVTQRGRLVGVLALGDWQELPRIQEALLRARVLLPWQLKRFEKTGRLWSEDQDLGIHGWPDDAVVCNCTGVTRATLSAAISGGCASVEQLITATGASSVCGSCRPLLAELVGAPPPVVDRTGLSGMALASFATLVVIVLLLLLPARWLVADSVQSPIFSLSTLWQDGLWKQVSGFSLLALGLVGLSLSLRKRVSRIDVGNYGNWRALHAALGALAVVLLLFHTGFQYGERLNAWLLTNYIVLGIAGAIAGITAVTAAALMSRTARQWQRWTALAHLYIAWPLPVLTAFHVLSVYYF